MDPLYIKMHECDNVAIVANDGYPYISTAVVTRAQVLAATGINLTRANQTVLLSQRGDERYEGVTMFDLRLSKSFRFGPRSITPQIDLFNITNAGTTVAHAVAVGGSYLAPQEILAPRIIRIGFSVNF